MFHGIVSLKRYSLLPSSAAWNLQAVVCRRRYLTIELFFHPLDASHHYIS